MSYSPLQVILFILFSVIYFVLLFPFKIICEEDITTLNTIPDKTDFKFFKTIIRKMIETF